MTIKHFTLIFLLLIPTITPVYADDYKDGMEAIDSEDYKTAFEKLKPFAETGDDYAQYSLGVLYDNGWGTSQNFKEAAKWYALSAEQGNSSSQYNLGIMYANDQGVALDYVQAHKWLSLAGILMGGAGPNTFSHKLEKQMTPDQINEAKKLTMQWIKSHENIITNKQKLLNDFMNELNK